MNFHTNSLKNNLRMSKKFLLIVAIFSIISACGASNGGDKKAELENLKKQQKEISDKITQLEKEIDPDTSAKSSEKALLVSVSDVTTETFNHYIELQGEVDAEDNVVVTPQMPGTIQDVFVEVGQNVKKGQVLADVDASTISAQI